MGCFWLVWKKKITIPLQKYDSIGAYDYYYYIRWRFSFFAEVAWRMHVSLHVRTYYSNVYHMVCQKPIYNWFSHIRFFGMCPITQFYCSTVVAAVYYSCFDHHMFYILMFRRVNYLPFSTVVITAIGIACCLKIITFQLRSIYNAGRRQWLESCFHLPQHK
jgi:hypothetical protein